MKTRLPKTLRQPLKGSREALLAGTEEIDGELRFSSRALANAGGNHAADREGGVTPRMVLAAR